MTFEEFWSKYPRKVAKLDARKMWARLTEDQQEAAITALPNHISFWNATTTPQYIPHAASWLNGERFEDELPEITPRGQEWWRSAAGIEAKGRELGLNPKPGESQQEYAGRIRARA